MICVSIILIVVVAIMVYVTKVDIYCDYCDSKIKSKRGKITARITSAVLTVIPLAIISSVFIGTVAFTSFNSYIKLEGYFANINQYAKAIVLYKENAITSVKCSKEITDLKYQNYQTQLGTMITDLRDVLVEYNKDLVKQKALKGNWFFKSVIYLPEDNILEPVNFEQLFDNLDDL